MGGGWAGGGGGDGSQPDVERCFRLLDFPRPFSFFLLQIFSLFPFSTFPIISVVTSKRKMSVMPHEHHVYI